MNKDKDVLTSNMDTCNKVFFKLILVFDVCANGSSLDHLLFFVVKFDMTFLCKTANNTLMCQCSIC